MSKTRDCTKKSNQICIRLTGPTQMLLKYLEFGNSLEFDRQISSLMLKLLFKIMNGLIEITLTFLPKKARLDFNGFMEEKSKLSIYCEFLFRTLHHGRFVYTTTIHGTRAVHHHLQKGSLS